MEAIREILNSAETDNLPDLVEQYLQQIIETPQIILGVVQKLTQQTIHFLRGKGVVIFERSKLRNLRGLEIPISETDIDTSQSYFQVCFIFALLINGISANNCGLQTVANNVDIRNLKGVSHWNVRL